MPRMANALTKIRVFIFNLLCARAKETKAHLELFRSGCEYIEARRNYSMLPAVVFVVTKMLVGRVIANASFFVPRNGALK
jgi:hypothetical protein